MSATLDTNSTALIATVLQGEIVFPVIMEDPIIHTAENKYQCGRRDCPCYLEAQHTREALPLNGNRGFSLLR